MKSIHDKRAQYLHNYNTWRLRHPSKHRQRVNHQARIQKGWYDQIPVKIKKLQEERDKMAEYYNSRINRYKRIQKQYKAGLVPTE